jgi:stearoyl-CoA desaturase (Delta-9 desaturase)
VNRGISWFGLVWDLHIPSKAVVRGEHKLGRRVINKVAAQLAASYPIDRVASRALEALAAAPGWAGFKSRMLSQNVSPGEFWAEIDQPHIPTLEEVRRHAQVRLAQTPSLDEIALSTRERLMHIVHL